MICVPTFRATCRELAPSLLDKGLEPHSNPLCPQWPRTRYILECIWEIESESAGRKGQHSCEGTAAVARPCRPHCWRQASTPHPLSPCLLVSLPPWGHVEMKILLTTVRIASKNQYNRLDTSRS